MNKYILLYTVVSIIEIATVLIIIKFKMTNIIKILKKHWALLALILYIIFSSLFYGNAVNKEYERLQDEKIVELDSIRELSKRKQDSLNRVIILGKEDFIKHKEAIDKINNINKIKNENLNKMDKSLDVIDTSFNNSAKRISDSVDRFYTGNDSIR